jgi:hypothetical protein
MEHVSSSRTGGVERAPTLFTRIIFFLTKRRLGMVPVPARIMALQPPLLRGGAFMEQAQEAATIVPIRLKKLAQMLTASRVGCPF